MLAQLGTVDEEMLPPDEEPAARSPLVAVVVLDELDDPTRALRPSLLALTAAVDDAARVVFIREVDDMVPDLEERDAGGAELPLEVGAERGMAARFAPDPHVRHEERDQRVELARVHVNGVAVRELLDLDGGEEALRIGHGRRF
jgi:hypothetical protein